MFSSSFWYYGLGGITVGVLFTLDDLGWPLWALFIVSVVINAVGDLIIRRAFPD